MRQFTLLLLVALCLPSGARAQQLVVELDIVGLNRNQADVATTLNDACDSIAATGTPNAAQADLLDTCAAIDALDEGLPALAAGLDRLVPEEAFVVSDALTDASDVQVTTVRSRLRRIRSERLETSATDAVGAVAAGRGLRSGGGAAADELTGSRLQLFVSGYVSSGEYDGATLQQDTDIGAGNVALGLDYRIGERFVVGAAIGFLRNETDFRRGPGGMSADSVEVTLFGTYLRGDTGYIDIALDVGGGSYELERQISLVGADSVIASADTDASTVSLSGGIGGSYAIGGWNFGPYARGSLTVASVDGYSETADSMLPGFGSTLRVGSQSVRSGTVSLGAALSRVIGTAKAVLIPELSVELQFEAEANKDDVSASFLADPDRNLLAVEGEERDTRSATVGVGGSAVFSGGGSAYVYLDTRVQHDYLSQRWLKAGFRWEF